MQELDPRIRIRAPLRCDGIGRLDCAEDLESGMRLAVRWLPLEANGDAAAKACEKLPDHPTLPKIRQTGQVGGSAFVAMDFPDGQLLSTRIGERMDTDLVLRIAAQLSDALATVHEQQVVHGEMSSDSVLLVPPDRAYLWDMPLVIANRLTDRRGENRLMQNLVKTAPYLSPERAQGSGASPESDVYSLGAVLCVAAGAPLPVAAATLGVVHLVASGAWFPRVPSTIPDPWRAMLARMVSTDPSSRPTSREVARAFAQVPMPASLPTVPEFPVVRLPPELMAAADAMLRRRPVEVDSDPRRTLEMPVVQSRTLARESADAPPAAPAEPAAAETTPSAPTEAAPAVSAEAKPAEPAEVKPAEVAEPVAPPRPTEPEAPAVDAPPTPAALAAAMAEAVQALQPSVPLTDSVAVAPELAKLSAVALPDVTDEEIAATRSKAPWIIAAAMAAAIVVLTVVAVNLATRPPVVMQPQQRTVAPVKRAAPKPAAKVEVTLPAASLAADEELAPVPVKRLAPAPAPRPRPVKAPAPVPAPAPAAAQPADPASATAAAPAAAPEEPPVAEDFGFLEGAEAPTSELKRPEL